MIDPVEMRKRLISDLLITLRDQGIVSSKDAMAEFSAGTSINPSQSSAYDIFERMEKTAAMTLDAAIAEQKTFMQDECGMSAAEAEAEMRRVVESVLKKVPFNETYAKLRDLERDHPTAKSSTPVPRASTPVPSVPSKKGFFQKLLRRSSVDSSSSPAPKK